jgi:hypothetical protein
MKVAATGSDKKLVDHTRERCRERERERGDEREGLEMCVFVCIRSDNPSMGRAWGERIKSQ